MVLNSDSNISTVIQKLNHSNEHFNLQTLVISLTWSTTYLSVFKGSRLRLTVTGLETSPLVFFPCVLIFASALSFVYPVLTHSVAEAPTGKSSQVSNWMILSKQNRSGQPSMFTAHGSRSYVGQIYSVVCHLEFLKGNDLFIELHSLCIIMNMWNS